MNYLLRPRINHRGHFFWPTAWKAVKDISPVDSACAVPEGYAEEERGEAAPTKFSRSSDYLSGL